MKDDCLYKVPLVVDENKQSLFSCLIKKKKNKMNPKAKLLQLCKSTLSSLVPVSVQTEMTWSVLELNSYLPNEEFSRHNYKCSHVMNEENHDPGHVNYINQIKCLIKFYLDEKYLRY